MASGNKIRGEIGSAFRERDAVIFGQGRMMQFLSAIHAAPTVKMNSIHPLRLSVTAARRHPSRTSPLVIVPQPFSGLKWMCSLPFLVDEFLFLWMFLRPFAAYGQEVRISNRVHSFSCVVSPRVLPQAFAIILKGTLIVASCLRVVLLSMFASPFPRALSALFNPDLERGWISFKTLIARPHFRFLSFSIAPIPAAFSYQFCFA